MPSPLRCPGDPVVIHLKDLVTVGPAYKGVRMAFSSLFLSLFSREANQGTEKSQDLSDQNTVEQGGPLSWSPATLNMEAPGWGAPLYTRPGSRVMHPRGLGQVTPRCAPHWLPAGPGAEGVLLVLLPGPRALPAAVAPVLPLPTPLSCFCKSGGVGGTRAALT